VRLIRTTKGPAARIRGAPEAQGNRYPGVPNGTKFIDPATSAFCPRPKAGGVAIGISPKITYLLIRTAIPVAERRLLISAHLWKNLANNPNFLQKLGNFPLAMGCFAGLVWLILALCS
jgi:hypothetical protein